MHYIRLMWRYERSVTMKVQGMVDPGRFTVEQIPGTNRSLVRLFQNVEPYEKDDFQGFQYDEYHVEVETWDGVAQNVLDNYDEFLKKGMDNEIDRSNEALSKVQMEQSRLIDGLIVSALEG